MFKATATVLSFLFLLGSCSPDEPKQDDATVALIKLIDRGWHGDARAIQDILACLGNSPQYERKEWAEYYWWLALERAGGQVDEDKMESAKSAIDSGDLWLVEEWHLDPESYPPFTSLKFVTC